MNTLQEELRFEEPIDLGSIIRKVAARRWWLASCIAIAVGASAAVAFLTEPVYRATTVLAPAVQDRGIDLNGFAASSLGGLASGLGLGPRDADTEEALAVLRSREFTERFITSQNLMPELFPSKWNSSARAWRVDTDHRPTLAEGYKYFNEQIRSISEDRKTGLVTLQIDWTDRQEAAKWANELVDELNAEMRRRAISQADASMEYLEDELRTTSAVEVRAAISKLMESQTKQRMLAHVTRDYSFRIVDRAITSDGEKPVKPRRLLLLTLGPLLGAAVGVGLILIVGANGRSLPSRSAAIPARPREIDRQ